MKRSLSQNKKFFHIPYVTFGRDTTNYRGTGTLVENVKKVQIQHTLVVSLPYCEIIILILKGTSSQGTTVYQ
jgi:hypothetical protein